MKNLSLLTILTLSVAFIQCSKDRIEPEYEYESMQEYLDSKKQEEQIIVITEQGDGPIVGKLGTKIWASKDDFILDNGDSLDYPFTVKLIELYTPKDMLYYELPTVSSESLLTTGGEVKLRVCKDDQEVSFRAGSGAIILMPNDNAEDNMNIYYGESTGDIIDWNTNNENFASTDSGYVGSISQLGWFSAGKQAVAGGETSRYTFSSEVDKLDNVLIFLYFPDIKSLVQVYNTNSIQIPNNQAVKVILMGQRSDGKLYANYQTATVLGNGNWDVLLAEISDGNLTAILDALGDI